MSLKKFISGVSFASAIVATSFILGGCTPKITQEQLQQLQQLRAQERNLSDMLDKKKVEKSKLERELQDRQGELKKCNDDKDFIQKKLAEWPNVWPDYKPEEPAGEVK